VGTNITGFSFNYIPNTSYATDLDFNGDGQIGSKDLNIMLTSFGSHLGDSRWNPIVDIVADNKIDGKDLTIFLRYYGETV
jgi:Ca2+-binding EF-hand superfamily protein